MSNNIEIIKKGYAKESFTDKQKMELAKCSLDPIYFIESYMMVQHPIKGRVPFKMYPYQKKMVKSFLDNKMCVALTGRQLGKCLFSTTVVTKNQEKTKIKELINHSFKEKIVLFLEELLVKIVRK